MKTRTNQPIVLPSTADIEHLSDTFIDQLKCGDIIIKKTGEQTHSYRVSYKQEKHGICLTYVDCGYMETISYDYTDGHWVFNSKDVCQVASKSETGTKLYVHHFHNLEESNYLEDVVDLIVIGTTYSYPIDDIADLNDLLETYSVKAYTNHTSQQWFVMLSSQMGFVCYSSDNHVELVDDISFNFTSETTDTVTPF